MLAHLQPWTRNLFALGAFFVSVGCAQAPSTAPPTAPEHAAEPAGAYFIDGAPVSEEAFNRLLSTFGEERSDWYCDDGTWLDENGIAQGGGEEGWKASDAEGRVYRVMFRSEGPDSRFEITRVQGSSNAAPLRRQRTPAGTDRPRSTPPAAR